EFQQVFLRMARYSPGSTPTHPQPPLPGPRGERPAVTGDAAKAAAEFLASVSLGNSEAIEYLFKTLPRPKGRSTKVLITEYDLPRKGALPHDSSSIRMGWFGTPISAPNSWASWTRRAERRRTLRSRWCGPSSGWR